LLHDAQVYTGEEHGREKAGSQSARTTRSTTKGGAPNSAAAAVGGHDLSGAPARPAPLAAPLDPKLYALEDEPLAEGRPVDYRYLYDLARDRLARDEDRGKNLDTKLATLLTGIVAAIGFSFRGTPNIVSSATALLYLLPLALIVSAYTTKLNEFAPDVASLESSFPTYPVSTLIEAVKAMTVANGVNSAKYERKAERLDQAVVSTLAVTLLALVAQLLVALKVVPTTF
jgi:hypothetical protein